MLSVTLTVRFCQLRVLYLLFLPSCSSFYSSSSSHFTTHTFFLFLILFFCQVISVISVRLLISWIYTLIFLTRTFCTTDSFQSYAHLPVSCRAFTSFCSCSLHARYVYFFSFSLLVMLLALTWFNFFHVFSPLHALSNLFLPATCSPSWFL